MARYRRRTIRRRTRRVRRTRRRGRATRRKLSSRTGALTLYRPRALVPYRRSSTALVVRRSAYRRRSRRYRRRGYRRHRSQRGLPKIGYLPMENCSAKDLSRCTLKKWATYVYFSKNIIHDHFFHNVAAFASRHGWKQASELVTRLVCNNRYVKLWRVYDSTIVNGDQVERIGDVVNRGIWKAMVIQMQFNAKVLSPDHQKLYLQQRRNTRISRIQSLLTTGTAATTSASSMQVV